MSKYQRYINGNSTIKGYTVECSDPDFKDIVKKSSAVRRMLLSYVAHINESESAAIDAFEISAIRHGYTHLLPYLTIIKKQEE